MSQDREKILRDLGEQIDRAASGEDAAALSELSTHLDERLTQARDLSDRAYAAVRDAFAGAAAGDNDKAVRVLEGELAAQADCPVLRMILARFYFDIAVDRDEKDGPAMTRAREHVIQAFRLRPNLALPERYFPPGFLSLVRETTGGKPAQNSRAPAVSPDPWSPGRERSHPERRALG